MGSIGLALNVMEGLSAETLAALQAHLDEPSETNIADMQPVIIQPEEFTPDPDEEVHSASVAIHEFGEGKGRGELHCCICATYQMFAR